jgi:hypothetical protein
VELRNEFRVDVPAADAWRLLTDVERIAPCLPGAQLQEIEGDEYRGMVKVKVGPVSAQYRGKATFVEQDEAAGRLVLTAAGRDTGGAGNANAVITATLTPDGRGTKVTVITDLAITGRVAQFGKGVLSDVSANLLRQFVDCLHQQLAAPTPPPVPPVPTPPAPRPAAPASAGEPEAPPAPAATGAARADAAAVVPEEATTAASAEPMAIEPPTAASTNGSAAEPAEEEPAPPGPEVRTVASRDVEPVDLFEAARRSLAKRAIPAGAGVAALIAVVLWWRRRK